MCIQLRTVMALPSMVLKQIKYFVFYAPRYEKYPGPNPIGWFVELKVADTYMYTCSSYCSPEKTCMHNGDPSDRASSHMGLQFFLKKLRHYIYFSVWMEFYYSESEHELTFTFYISLCGIFDVFAIVPYLTRCWFTRSCRKGETQLFLQIYLISRYERFSYAGSCASKYWVWVLVKLFVCSINYFEELFRWISSEFSSAG